MRIASWPLSVVSAGLSLLPETPALAFGTLADKKGPAPVRGAEPCGAKSFQNSNGVHGSSTQRVRVPIAFSDVGILLDLREWSH
jgi:hypothetical protein